MNGRQGISLVPRSGKARRGRGDERIAYYVANTLFLKKCSKFLNVRFVVVLDY